LRGQRPILEIMFGDFMALGLDQVVNGISKFREMYDDQVTVPLVVRAPMGARRGYGPTHSQSLEKLLLGIPTSSCRGERVPRRRRAAHRRRRRRAAGVLHREQAALRAHDPRPEDGHIGELAVRETAIRIRR
jgi:hypothetical protein